MKKIEIIDYKSAYDELQQMDYDQLYKLLKEYGNAIWYADEGEEEITSQDPPVITVQIEGTYFCQDAEVLVARIVNDEVILEVLPQDSYETYTVRDIKKCVAYYNIHYISESYVEFLNSKDHDARRSNGSREAGERSNS